MRPKRATARPYIPMTYSVAIRTLGLDPQTLERVLRGVFAQTVRPEKVMVYIARGYRKPDFRVGSEEYVEVGKGMMRQRALDYKEITSDCILMLDDDLEMDPDVAGRLLKAISEGYDLVGCDVFKNHKMSLTAKVKAAVTNLVRPHKRNYGFALTRSGSFLYPRHPEEGVCDSDTCAGNIMMWRRQSLLGLRLTDEIWLDSLGFAYGDDALISYKATANGLKVGVDFDAEVTNLDRRTSSDLYRRDPERYYIRAKAMTMTWWRMIYQPLGRNVKGNPIVHGCGLDKALWVSFLMIFQSIFSLSHRPFTATVRGIKDGAKEAENGVLASLPPYIISNK